ncbi:MAG: OB-fold putative lipoprotein [Ferruginibacter sp.]|nr:OB-fold putative lipoprotein [Ferruginibacter sp.]
MIDTKKRSPWLKRILLVGIVLLIAGGIAIWYIFTEKFTDTSKETAAYTVNAMDLIKEFQDNDSISNKKYTEKIITVNGRITETESADTTINIKMRDTLTDAYIIFAFQQQHLKEAKQLKEGDSVSIKGSCSGGTYSKILETSFITFKRCTLNK